MRNAILYHDKAGGLTAKPVWLCKGSVAYELHGLPKWDKLVAHMKQLDKNARMLEQFGRYEQNEGKKQC